VEWLLDRVVRKRACGCPQPVEADIGVVEAWSQFGELRT
jgi:hypothetical protein